MLAGSVEGEALQRLLPHSGSMCLIDQVIRCDETSIECLSESHTKEDNPLREGDRLSAIHAAEYAAQAMALHGGLLAQRTGQRQPGGYLVSLRGVTLHASRLDTLGSTLVIQAKQLLADSGNMLYDFTVSTDKMPVAEGRAAVIVYTEEIL
ncbi:MAG: 3-hydroxylacyl-ACP dehydratase [Candidatus Thiodiazotropha sp. (ex Dulcina madagascariensis)]|nr:3-hydroxylacyl-ACP dehydratase [Candidatus Thiodiazotropha sp. (ex Dulcina madagascariensis)]MCU7926784.1 3-hydroxylacyl-ACP dehydratase [Candidatus Thiodiazotropha sp. (ex Dulcina madagascariensis)]